MINTSIPIAGGKCRTGCLTKDHTSYSQCSRGIQLSTGIAIGTLKQQDWDRELRAYKRARAEGIQPDGTQMHQVEQAKKISDATGVAYGS